MAARHRNTLVVCRFCHKDLHQLDDAWRVDRAPCGKRDGPSTRPIPAPSIVDDPPREPAPDMIDAYVLAKTGRADLVDVHRPTQRARRLPSSNCPRAIKMP